MASIEQKSWKALSIEDLPFVADRKGKRRLGQLGRCFWNVTPTNSYAADCDTGVAFALKYLAYQRETEDGAILQCIVADMPRELSGVETAFLETIALAAASSCRAALAVIGADPSSVISLEDAVPHRNGVLVASD